MNKEELDQLYHNLRKLCVEEDIIQKEAIVGITSHLTNRVGDYTGLLRFLSYYGENYILPSVIKLIKFSANTLKFSRVVELGAGFGWLGRGISNAFSVPPLFVDKRHWPLIDIVADIEAHNGVKRVLDEMREGDLIVMSELLHCLDNPEKTMQPFTKWPLLVVEYMPTSLNYRESYTSQIKMFMCKPIGNIESVFPEAKILTANADPYMIWLMLPL